MRRESHKEVTTDFPHPKAKTEIEDKGRLPDKLAAKLVRQLDAGMRMEVPGWGRYAIRALGVSRIIDRYYDTPDRMFQTWSKVHGKQGRTTASQFEACTQALRAVLHIPKEEPPPLLITSLSQAE